MLSGDERDRTANLLVANQVVETIRKSFGGNSLGAIARLRAFSRIYQHFPGIRRVYHRFCAVAEPCSSMRSIESVDITLFIAGTRPVSMGPSPSAVWARLSQASLPRRASV